MAERFEFNDGSSNKFWTISLEGTGYTVHFGRIGTQGQMQTKDFGSESVAKIAYDKLVAEKTKKGYVRVGEAHMPADMVARPTSAGASKAAPEPNVASSATSGDADSDAVASSARSTLTAVAERDDAELFSSAPTPPQRLTQVGAPSVPPTPPPAQPAASPPYHAAAPAPVSGSPSVRNIRLDDTDWSWATWRPRTPRQKPQARPFDLKDATAAREKLPKFIQEFDSAWKRDRISVFDWSKSEARFWLFYMTQMDRIRDSINYNSVPVEEREKRKHEKVMALAADHRIEEDKPLQWYFELAANSLGGAWAYNRLSIALPLFSVLSLEALAHVMQLVPMDVERVLAVQFHELVLPYLTEAELADFRSLLRRKYKFDPAKVHAQDRAPYMMASAIGMHEEVRALMEALQPSDQPHARVYVVRAPLPQDFIFGLPSAEEVDYHWRRLNLDVLTDDHARALVACVEEKAIDSLEKYVNHPSLTKEDAQKRFPLLALVEAEPTAVPMAHLYNKSKVQGLAKDWLDKFPDWTISQLIPLATGRSDLADTARNTLRDLYARGLTGGVSPETREALQNLCQTAEDRLESMTDATSPAWLVDGIKGSQQSTRKAKLPTWSDPRTLSPIVIDGRRMNHEQAEAVLVALQQSDWQNVHPLIRALQTNVERRSFEKFLWELFESWMRNDAPSKEKWALMAMGHLGGDECALKLTPFIRVWPGASQHQRAVLGLEVLRHIGTDTALMQINGIAQKLPFKALKSRAMECIEEIAKDKGFTRDQLEDRIIPDCGLDERGGKLFDFGPRQFNFVLTSEMKPMVKDATGALKSDLPKPGTKDDAAKAEAAVADWKLLKQQVKEVAKVQAFRMEQSMIGGRRWSIEDFEQLMVKHPLMINLVRMVVWAGYDKNCCVVKTFRVAEDQTYADSEDRQTTIDDLEVVGIVHAAHLSDELKSRWGEVLSDYEIQTPFQQIGRSVIHLTPDELKGREIKRFAQLKIPAVTIVGALEKNGWIRGEAADGGVFTEHSRYFPGADVTAFVVYPGIGMQYIVGSDDQAITSCFFEKGKPKREWYRTANNGSLPLADVDPVVVSEVLRLLLALTSKAQG